MPEKKEVYTGNRPQKLQAIACMNYVDFWR